MPNKCPYCDYVTPAEEPGTEQTWQEIAHMQLDHPEIIRERLQEGGLLDVDAGFAAKRLEPVTLHVPGDLSVQDFTRLVRIVAGHNHRLNLKDEQVQRIETALDTMLMEIEKGTP